MLLAAALLFDLFFTKQIGLGAAVAVAVAVDASIVRALLVPALMALMGDWNWWAPAPLKRLHRCIGLAEMEEVAAKAAQPERANAV